MLFFHSVKVKVVMDVKKIKKNKIKFGEIFLYCFGQCDEISALC